MRQIAILCASLGLLFSAGCSIHDAMFGALGTYYSDGVSREEREYNYHRQVEAWNSYHPHPPEGEL